MYVLITHYDGYIEAVESFANKYLAETKRSERLWDMFSELYEQVPYDEDGMLDHDEIYSQAQSPQYLMTLEIGTDEEIEILINILHNE